MGWAKQWVSNGWLERLRTKNLPAGFSHLPLFFIALVISSFGLIMIYSSSAVLGIQQHGDAFYFVKKHLFFLIVGWALYFIFAQICILKVSRYRLFFLVASILLLVAVKIPGLGSSGGGAQRWLSLGILRFQPSELVRMFLIFYIAATLSFRSDRLRSFNKGFLPLLVVTSVLMFLLLLQPDFGGAMSIFLISVALWFVGGIPFGYLAGLAILSVPAVVFILFQASYRAERVFTFLNPWRDPQGSGFQVIQSLVAFFDGGWFGVGLGNSQQKLFYLPKAHNDFIFSVVGEELGVFGVILVVGMFVGILICGARIARLQLSQLGYLLGTGLTLFFCLPAIFNMMVALGMLPTKGLPLPFFSSGGSSLIVSMAVLGVLQSLHFYRDEEVRL